MEPQIEFTPAQIEVIKSLLGLESLEGVPVKLKFEVQSAHSDKMIATEASANSSFTVKMCYCGNGIFSPRCC